jgi:hypothetical protein
MGVAKRMKFLSGIAKCVTHVLVALLGWFFGVVFFKQTFPLSHFFGSAGATTWLELHLVSFCWFEHVTKLYCM